MSFFARLKRNTCVSGTFAALLSAAMLLHRSRRDGGTPVAALNAVSHWLHGDDAYHADRPDLRHTLLGGVTHGLSAMMWAALHEALIAGMVRSSDASDRPLAPRGSEPSVGDVLLTAAVVTGVAAITDLRLVPPRLSPGFEHRLRPASLAGVYAAFGAGLALRALLAKRY